MRIIDDNSPTEPLFEVNGKIGTDTKQVFVTAKDEAEARFKATVENPGLVIDTVYDITAAA